MKHDISTLKRNDGKADVGAIGVNKISVFPGFCSYHDKALFAPVEDVSFDATPEQCALLSYRAIARERHTKAAGIDVNDFLKNADRGRPLAQQIELQNFLSGYGTGLSLAEDDLDRAIGEHHAAILDGSFDRFETLVLEFDDFPLLCTTGHMPSDDWAGRIVQNLKDPTLKADWVSAVSFQSGGRAWVTFSWLKTRTIMRDFVHTLVENYKDTISDALIKYFFTISENIAMREKWWSQLSAARQKALRARIMDGSPIQGGVNITAPRKGEPVVLEQPLLSVRTV